MKAKEFLGSVLCFRAFLSPGVKASDECDNERECPNCLVYSWYIVFISSAYSYF